MSRAIYYPPASRAQWYGAGNAIVDPHGVLWHTTETTSWPSYSGGGTAPNLTYSPWEHRWRQHFQINGSARALRNGPSYSTNRMGFVQVEVICYCDPARFSTGRGVHHLDAQAYNDMGNFAEFMRAEWGVPSQMTVGTKPYPSSYGAGNGVRLSPAAFRGYRGHLGHMHAPYNDHGDFGALDIRRALSNTTEGDMPLNDDDKRYIRDMIIDLLRAPEFHEFRNREIARSVWTEFAWERGGLGPADATAWVGDSRVGVGEALARLDRIEALLGVARDAEPQDESPDS